MNVSRRQARVFAMQVLYGIEMSGNAVGEVLPAVIESLEPTAPMQSYGMRLVDLVQEHALAFDEILRKYAQEWDLERMAVLDRIILRIALAELLHIADVPVKVVILEAVQVANKYSTDDSGAFINGILNQFAQDRQMFGDQNPA